MLEVVRTKTRAAICWGVGKEWSVEEIDLDAPRHGEVLVRVAAAGLCHSDDHIVTGDSPMPTPMIGGHEGAGVVEEVGPGVTSLAPGDHVVLAFIPSCGRCVPCSTGHQNLCDLGALIGYGRQADGTSRHHAGGRDLQLMCLVGVFADFTVVNEASCIKIDPDLSLRSACLAGCGAVTGWGSAVYAADVRAGETVVVVGDGRYRCLGRAGGADGRSRDHRGRRPGGIQTGTGRRVRRRRRLRLDEGGSWIRSGS